MLPVDWLMTDSVSLCHQDNNDGGQIESHKLRIYPLGSHQASTLCGMIPAIRFLQPAG